MYVENTLFKNGSKKIVDNLFNANSKTIDSIVTIIGIDNKSMRKKSRLNRIEKKLTNTKNLIYTHFLN